MSQTEGAQDWLLRTKLRTKVLMNGDKEVSIPSQEWHQLGLLALVCGWKQRDLRENQPQFCGT